MAFLKSSWCVYVSSLIFLFIPLLTGAVTPPSLYSVIDYNNCATAGGVQIGRMNTSGSVWKLCKAPNLEVSMISDLNTCVAPQSSLAGIFQAPGGSNWKLCYNPAKISINSTTGSCATGYTDAGTYKGKNGSGDWRICFKDVVAPLVAPITKIGDYHTADAGPDQTVTANVATLAGSVANCDSSYWRGGTVSNRNSLAPTVSNLAIGNNFFTLTCIYNGTSYNSDSVNITYNLNVTSSPSNSTTSPINTTSETGSYVVTITGTDYDGFNLKENDNKKINFTASSVVAGECTLSMDQTASRGWKLPASYLLAPASFRLGYADGPTAYGYVYPNRILRDSTVADADRSPTVKLNIYCEDERNPTRYHATGSALFNINSTNTANPNTDPAVGDGPTVEAGASQTVTQNQTQLNGRASGCTSYRWSKPSTSWASIGNSSSLSTYVSNLAKGQNTFTLTCNYSGGSKSDTVSITYTPPTVIDCRASARPLLESLPDACTKVVLAGATIPVGTTGRTFYRPSGYTTCVASYSGGAGLKISFGAITTNIIDSLRQVYGGSFNITATRDSSYSGTPATSFNVTVNCRKDASHNSSGSATFQIDTSTSGGGTSSTYDQPSGQGCYDGHCVNVRGTWRICGRPMGAVCTPTAKARVSVMLNNSFGSFTNQLANIILWRK
ncbi:MAG: hypothetical protein A2607_00630 [Candidatus Vogelbacteria bacterium RIFOXYD1_FULL_42_15]|uniref:Ig-like domain-containing protein n=1 Tax=Candidatus Vogelbacteria bacterium RIFOXYD1_FULL_42_15 TaxID=1802437 RepID=A0A1G2QH88_9BACT|nr:MAG: hypothetical protein A2607_00630 [Candidatus Vogelbacteria bacterium RIFOXYD1_FULL_42_15]